MYIYTQWNVLADVSSYAWSHEPRRNIVNPVRVYACGACVRYACVVCMCAHVFGSRKTRESSLINAIQRATRELASVLHLYANICLHAYAHTYTHIYARARVCVLSFLFFLHKSKRILSRLSFLALASTGLFFFFWFLSCPLPPDDASTCLLTIPSCASLPAN